MHDFYTQGFHYWNQIHLLTVAIIHTNIPQSLCREYNHPQQGKHETCTLLE